MNKWNYFNNSDASTSEPKIGQDVLLLFPDGIVTLHEWMLNSRRDFGEAEAWFPAPERRLKYVPVSLGHKLFGSSYKDCRFKVNARGDWLYGQLEGISLDGLSFYCVSYDGLKNGEAPEWVQVCEVAACR